MLKGRPFLNRDLFRRHLRALTDGSSQILVVSGPAGSGRSYSWELIFHVAAALGTIRLARATVESGPDAAQLDPQALARRLGLHLPDSGENGSAVAGRRIEVLARELVDGFAGSGERWWIVLDGFENRELPQGTRDLVAEMMRHASAPEHRGQLGLLLLAYDESNIPDSLRPFVLVEHLAPITRHDLAYFFEALFRDAGQSKDYLFIEQIVDDVLRDRSPEDMAGLARAVALVVRHLERDR